MNGLIHEKLDIKILILYALEKLPGPVDSGDLYDVCRCDEGVGYFDFSDCLFELIDSGLAESTDDGYLITSKGRNNVREIGNSLPFSVRASADAVIAPLCKKILRASLVSVDWTPADSGYMVHFSLNDGEGDLLKMNLLVPDEARAKVMKKNFKRKAEYYYNSIVQMLMEKE